MELQREEKPTYELEPSYYSAPPPTYAQNLLDHLEKLPAVPKNNDFLPQNNQSNFQPNSPSLIELDPEKEARRFFCKRIFNQVTLKSKNSGSNASTTQATTSC
jgi:hypothetical protein